MKKISVITTGVTIGSMLTSDAVALDGTSKRLLREIEIAKHKLGCSVSLISPIHKSSEDFTPEDWCTLLQSVQNANSSNSDGILITHGTDTLAFSVAAVVAFSHLWDKKVCFTGAFYPPDHRKSDVSINLQAALEFTVSSRPSNGIFVAFRSNRLNNQANIIDGTVIKPMNFDDEIFNGAYGLKVATFTPKEGLSNQLSMTSIIHPTIPVNKLPTCSGVAAARKKVSMLSIYPGIDRKILLAAADSRDVIILDLYHSGAGPSENSELIEFLSEQSDDLTVLMGAYPSAHMDLPYQSTVNIKNSGAFIYSNLQPHFLYVFSLDVNKDIHDPFETVGNARGTKAMR